MLIGPNSDQTILSSSSNALLQTLSLEEALRRQYAALRGTTMVVNGAVSVSSEDAEMRRIEARRHRENERLKKLGPGRLRSIGADIAGVKNQIEEKQREKEAEKDAGRREAEENESIRRYLLQVESEDAMAKRREMLLLRNDWRNQAAQREEAKQREAQELSLGVNLEGCAPGAAQKFEGEDPLKLERTRLQALQMKQWTTQQMEEKKQRDAMEAQEQAKYMQYLMEIERLQQSLYEATEKERAQIALELQRYNLMLQEHRREQEKRRQEAEQQQNAAEINHVLQSHLVSENPLQAQLPGVSMDHRVRVDHWKGLSSEQTKQFLSENEKLLAEKARQAELARQQAQDEARQQAELQRILAEEEHITHKKKALQQLQIKQTLDQQAHEAAERERKNKEQARGKIEKGFFQGFGRSYR